MSGVTGTILEYVLFAVQIAGLPALFLIFVLKGALIGKVVPTSVILPGYVFAADVSISGAVLLVLVLTAAHVIGQLLIVVGVRRQGVSVLSRLPLVSLDPDSPRLKRADRWFHRHGDLAVFTTNLVPWLRGMIAVPVGMVSYPLGRFTVYVGTSALVYHAVYVGLAVAGVAIVT